MKNHNLYVVCNLICIVLFIYIPIHIWIFKDYENTYKALLTLASLFIELILIEALRDAIKKNNIV